MITLPLTHIFKTTIHLLFLKKKIEKQVKQKIKNCAHVYLPIKKNFFLKKSSSLLKKKKLNKYIHVSLQFKLLLTSFKKKKLIALNFIYLSRLTISNPSLFTSL